MYFRWLAIIDTIFLLNTLPRHWIIGVYDFDFRDFSNAACKIHNFTSDWLKDMAGWSLVCIATERAIGIFWPLKHKVYFTKRHAIILLVIVTVALIIKTCHMLFGFHISTDANRMICTTSGNYNYFMTDIYFWLDLFLYLLLPMLIISICNIGILCIVHRQSNLRKGGHVPSKNRMVSILLGLSIAYILCVTPITVSHLVREVLREQIAADANMAADMFLLKSFGVAAAFVNSSVNMFLYCISGTLFRKELKLMFHCQS